MGGIWGKTAINAYVLITGYFMCKSQMTVCGGLLPGARGSGDGQPLFPRHCGGHSDGHPAEGHGL